MEERVAPSRASDSGDSSGTPSFRVQSPSLSLPKGGGAIRGIGETFTANPATGTGSVSVPIATSPGRAGFAPQLSLAYDSAAGNGGFGFGWRLSLPAITRRTDKGLPQYRDAQESDVFVLSGAEDLVPVQIEAGDGTWQREPSAPRTVSGIDYLIDRYRPRIEGLFAQIERWTNVSDPHDVFWRSISKDNVTTWYGRTRESRICDPEDARRIFAWLICESHDDKGQALVYGYKPEDSARVFEDAGGAERALVHERNRTARSRSAQRYPKTIRYGNRQPYFPVLRDDAPWPMPQDALAADASDAWLFEVVFDYGEHDALAPTPDAVRAWPARADAFSTYRAGFEIRTYRICRRVLMFHHVEDAVGIGPACLVRSTDLSYSDSLDPADERHPVYLFLREVTQTGYRRNGAGYDRRSLPPLEFEYSVPAIQDSVENVDPRSLEHLPSGLDGATYLWTDLHGEGAPGIFSAQGGSWYYKRNLSPIPERGVDGRERIKARFAPTETVSRNPTANLGEGARFMDLSGDGCPDLVTLHGPVHGLYAHDEAEGWMGFHPFASRAIRDLSDPNLRFVDLDGDGHADLFLSEDDAFVWHSSLADEGFGPSQRIPKALDEEHGPRIVFADDGESVFLADLSGDGLADIVRIRNGEICYWPNLGHGRFGAKVTMEDAPWFDQPEQFEQARLRLADIDGSGTADLLYLHREGVRAYFNRSGNGWSRPHVLGVFPRVDELKHIAPLDLFGNGTACLVWSSPLAADARAPMRYVDLMGGRKPHLLIRVANNLGAETRIAYAPSTRFYLQDRRDGDPWITRLPFPVQVVERVETVDYVSRSRFVTRYAYHHGYYDPVEREFRGFGMVEQWDTEAYAAFAEGRAEADGFDSDILEATNFDAAVHVPAVHTKTWFHTGVHLARNRISDHFADTQSRARVSGYFREPGIDDDAFRAQRLPDTVLPEGLSVEAERQACRALKGAMLRQEVYADDAGLDADAGARSRARMPYSVVERNARIRMLQPDTANRHAVFLVYAGEEVRYDYERNPTDPRIAHAMTLEVDDRGNILKQVEIAYGRRSQVRRVDSAGNVQLVANPGLEALHAADRPTQTTARLIYVEHRFTSEIDDADARRGPLPCETSRYELTGYVPTGPDGRYRAQDFVGPDPMSPGRLRHEFVAPELPYEAVASGARRRRPVGRVRTLYRRDDLTGLLPLGQSQVLALPGESYKLAFTPGLIAEAFQRPRQGRPADILLSDPADVLGGVGPDRGGYLPSQTLKADGRFPADDPDGHWWIPSGRVFYSPQATDSAAVEKAQALGHFFVQRRYRDAFGQDTNVDFDAHDLLMHETRDALGNRVRVESIDYRVQQPRMIADANGNRSAVAYDLLGMVTATAVMGKPLPAMQEGDSLDGLVVDPVQAQIDAFFDAADPRAHATGLLQNATTRILYDFGRFHRSRLAHPDAPDAWQPAFIATLMRETHVDGASPPPVSRIDLSFSYSDGFGREIQRKIRAEPGPLIAGGPVVDPRWVGSGWVIHNNKGKPVRQYEPFFSQRARADGTRYSDHRFEFGVAVGVSAVLFYDPAGRVVATLHPDHTYEKTVFDAWRQVVFDANDTCAARNAQTGDPRTDPDVGGYLAAYFAMRSPGWRTWRGQRIGGDLGGDERDAAVRAAAHADTPTVVHSDPLGRAFLTIAHNRIVCAGHDADGEETLSASRVTFDIEGNPLAVRDASQQAGDALGRIVARSTYAMSGQRVRYVSMEAGARWMLDDVVGQPIRAWDDRGHDFVNAYDALRRPVRRRVRGTTTESDPRTLGRDVVVERIEYGEALAGAEALNLRTRIYRRFDSSGVTINARLDADNNPIAAFDFKGNQLHGSKRLLSDYAEIADWDLIPAPVLDAELFASTTRYDARNRPVQTTATHSSLDRVGRLGKFNILQPVFNDAGLLERLDVWLEHAFEPAGLLDPGVAPPSPVGVAAIDYDAKGQRLAIDYKNGARAAYRYDPLNFRLLGLSIRRDPLGFPSDDPQPPLPGWPGRLLQNLRYTYDPVGNIVHIRDDAQQAVFFRNRRVESGNDYVYDASYRLLQAAGREHLGQLANGNRKAPTASDAFDAAQLQLDHPGDGHAMGRYVERYVYDIVGNLLRMQHRGDDPAHAGWTRAYEYVETSQIENGVGGSAIKTSNRLSRTRLNPNGGHPPQSDDYLHDAHGNVTRMPHLGGGGPAPNLHWDYRDRLLRVDMGGGGRAFCVYDAAGERVRKVWEKAPGLIEERIYLGGFEIFRRHQGAIGAASLRFERETLHVMDDKQRIALVELRSFDAVGGDPAPRRAIRYQHGNHLGSVSLELDEQAAIVTYEEYAPFGSSTYQAVRSHTETPKRYRYSGMERDEESGFAYHHARYYAPWLGRWLAADPAGLVDGPNLYRYARNNPIRLNDPNGMDPPDDDPAPVRITPFVANYSLFGVSFAGGSGSGGLGLIGAHTRSSFGIEVPRLSLSTTGFADVSGAAGFDTRLGVGALRLDGGVVLGPTSGLHLTTTGTASLRMPITSDTLSQGWRGALTQGLLGGEGALRLSGNIAAGGFNLAEFQARATLSGGRFQARLDANSLLDIARLRVDASGALGRSGDSITLETLKLHAHLQLPAVDLTASGSATRQSSGAYALRASGDLRLFWLPSLHVTGSGTASDSGVDFAGSFYGAGPLFTSYITGDFDLSTSHGVSGRAGVFGVTYTPGVSLTDPSPPSPGVTAIGGAERIPWSPSGLTIGASFFQYRQGNLTHVSGGLMPDISENIFTNLRFGFTARLFF
ncbi:MAG: toxin [Lysobacteraceae bacterium]|nr:MAG: toxin [Xanthomonadaceae bacterium]